VGREPFERFEPAAEIVGDDEVAEMLPAMIVTIVMVALDGRFLDRPVHPLHLSVSPRVIHLGQAMLGSVLVARAVEDVVEGIFMTSVVGELDPVIGQHDVNAVRHGRDRIAQELRRDHLAAFLMPFDKRRFNGPVDCHEQT